MGPTVTDPILAIVANAAAIVCLFVVGRAIYYPFWARWASHAGHIAHYERLYGALTQAQLELLLGFVRGQGDMGEREAALLERQVRERSTPDDVAVG
jgi:hypothetical protein